MDNQRDLGGAKGKRKRAVSAVVVLLASKKMYTWLGIPRESRANHAEIGFSTIPKWFTFALTNTLDINLARESRLNHAERERELRAPTRESRVDVKRNFLNGYEPGKQVGPWELRGLFARC